MATYAAETDVEALVAQWVIDGSSKPTSTQLTTLLESSDAEMDAMLSAEGVTVPFVSDGSDEQDKFATFLTGTNALGAAALWCASAFPDVTGPGEVPIREYLQARYDSRLKMLQSGAAIPNSVAAGKTLHGPITMNTEFPSTEPDLGTYAQPAFKRSDVETW